MRTFNNLADMQPYYNEETNTYVFAKKGIRFDVCITFDLNIDSDIYASNIYAFNIKVEDINAYNIHARNINARDINAGNIHARNINAQDINAFCIDAWNINTQDLNASNINARNIKACNIYANDIENSKYFCLDGEVKIG